ncbi:MAG TPA: hypothetical protein VFU76_11420 [Terriglobales bacterium]|nr:hypothetical protein [Terriglobales bacterium]
MVLKALVKVLEVVFFLGWAGCAITIPVAAWKYCSVILERDDEPDEAEGD